MPSLVSLLDDGFLVRHGFDQLVDGVAVLPSLVCLLDDGLLILQEFVELVDGVAVCLRWIVCWMMHSW